MISVAIATYNGEKFLPAQLDSIVTQTVLPDEVVIHDDGSSDSTLHIAEQYAAQYPQIKWDIKRNLDNLGFARNFLGTIRSCNGDIIILCDQDDIWKKEKVEKILAFFEDPRVLSVHGDIDIIDQNGNMINHCALQYKKHKEYVSLDCFFRHIYYCGMSSAFRSSLIPDLHLVDETILPTHDWLIHAAAVCRGGFYKTNEILASRRSHENNAALNLEKTERTGSKQRKDVIDYYCLHYELLCELYEKIGNNPKDLKFIQKVLAVNIKRRNYIENQSIRQALGNIRFLHYYPTIKSYVSDLLYLIHIF